MRCEVIAAGAVLESAQFGRIVVRDPVAMGHRFAVRDLPAGKWIKQYGQPFARSLGVGVGEAITERNSPNEVPHVDAESIELRTPVLPPWEGERPTFMGFQRADGRVGVRNWVLVVPTSMCSSHEATTIALRGEMGIWSARNIPTSMA